ncbi:hypothetical protein SAY87_020879 [Trapa incisa]|uniref:Uncharacterized protein n=1 Tax=Trapa incisa TaxID=236973 RepID=A0AAN7JRG1_9MYRT|nr:hypothetical protein SAY87_020879 [Trapa incisa]
MPALGCCVDAAVAAPPFSNVPLTVTATAPAASLSSVASMDDMPCWSPSHSASFRNTPYLDGACSGSLNPMGNNGFYYCREDDYGASEAAGDDEQLGSLVGPSSKFALKADSENGFGRQLQAMHIRVHNTITRKLFNQTQG